MLNVIYVDDEFMALDNFTLMLKKLIPDQPLTTFQDGSEALAYAQVNHIDVAFLGINMRLNGMDLADELHNIDQELKIVFVTAYNNYAFEAFQRDAYGYLLKPMMKIN